jgi:hypothetical protein
LIWHYNYLHAKQYRKAHQEKKMTQASEIMATARTLTECIEAAERQVVKTDQDWATGSTIYSFEDESVLVVSGLQLSAYAGRVYPQYKVKADKETGEWMGYAEFVDYVACSEWNAKADTENSHFDTYEVDDQTRAIEVMWSE